MLIPLDLPPGIMGNGTDFQSSGRWRDGNLVRWTEGVLRPVRGWQAYGTGSITGVSRGAHAWTDVLGNAYIATGTATGLFVFTDGNTVGDLTPTGLTAGQVDGGGAVAQTAGYGAGDYGTSNYGDLQVVAPAEATVWALDNWGQNLVACNQADGQIYEWEPVTPTAASIIANAPTQCSSILVTEERILMALSAGGDPRKVQWSDQEDNTVWTAAATNQAGDFRLQTQGKIMQGVKARGQILILTDADAFQAQYVGANDVYRFDRVGSNCGAVSRMSAVDVDRGVYWFGRNGFYSYDGQVTNIPCAVHDEVFTDLNQSQITKVWGCANPEFSEIWWFYPSAASVEIDRYVAYNYRENIWTFGALDRTAGIPPGTFGSPVWIISSGQAYIHERGFEYDGATPYAETGPISLDTGDSTMTALKLYPDEDTQGEVTATFKTRLYPNDTERSFGPYTMSAPTSVRFSGRQIRMRVTANVSDDWRVGVMRLDVAARGRR